MSFVHSASPSHFIDSHVMRYSNALKTSTLNIYVNVYHPNGMISGHRLTQIFLLLVASVPSTRPTTRGFAARVRGDAL